MTEQMTDDRLDRTLRDVLAREAGDLAGAPRADEMALRIAQGIRPARSLGATLRPLAWVALAGLVLAALLGAMLFAAARRPVPALTGYEAVFLRLAEGAVGREPVAIGIAPDGIERVIARLPGIWGRTPTGGVTPGGLLGIPSTQGNGNPDFVTWEVLDLHRPEMAPVVMEGTRQFIEQGREPYFHLEMRASVFSGPGERIAMPWYRGGGADWFVTIFDGTGSAWTAAVPEGLRVLPYWPATGSGVVVGNDTWGRIEDPRVLLPDGTVEDLPAGGMQAACRAADASGHRLELGAGVGWACLAPDDSMTVIGLAEPQRISSTLVTPLGVRREVEGQFVGWIASQP